MKKLYSEMALIKRFKDHKGLLTFYAIKQETLDETGIFIDHYNIPII